MFQLRSWRNWQTRYLEGVVTTNRMGSSPIDRTIYIRPVGSFFYCWFCPLAIRKYGRESGEFILQMQKIEAALAAIEDLCGKCSHCSPDCPVAIARRALQGLAYDMKAAEGWEEK